MTMGPEYKRIKMAAPGIWEVIGTFEKTSRGVRSVGRQRQYLSFHPLARVSTPWPELDNSRLSVVWNGRPCNFTPRQGDQYRLLRLLVNAKGRWVDYLTIATECLGGECASGGAIRQFKCRLVRTLKAGGMSDLAAAIIAENEKMRLKF
jgi:hypothetical protein